MAVDDLSVRLIFLERYRDRYKFHVDVTYKGETKRLWSETTFDAIDELVEDNVHDNIEDIVTDGRGNIAQIVTSSNRFDLWRLLENLVEDLFKYDYTQSPELFDEGFLDEE